jgi:hypothetical protein
MLPGKNDMHAEETETHEGVHQCVDVQPGARLSVEFRTPVRRGGRSSSIVVRVVDENGAPVPEARVNLSSKNSEFGEGFADGEGVCIFDGLHDSIGQQKLYASAHAPGFYIGSRGSMVTTGSNGKHGEATVTLRRPVKIRVRLVEEATGKLIPDGQIELQSDWGFIGRPYPELEDEHDMEVEVLPGEIQFRASSPWHYLAERTGHVSYDEPPPVFELRLKRLPS